jgi:hypothetical protein
LVYICALAPDETETSQGQQDKFPVTDVFAHVEIADGRAWMLPSGAACFAGDLPAEEQKVVWATHYAPAADLFLHNAPGVAWRTKPSWYIVGSNDHTVNPELERGRGQANGRHDLRIRQQPRSDAVPARPRSRRHPDRRKVHLNQQEVQSAPGCSMTVAGLPGASLPSLGWSSGPPQSAGRSRRPPYIAGSSDATEEVSAWLRTSTGFRPPPMRARWSRAMSIRSPWGQTDRFCCKITI